MSIGNIVVTYDFTEETNRRVLDYVAQFADPIIGDIGDYARKGRQEGNVFRSKLERRVFGLLKPMGVEVEMLTYEQIVNELSLPLLKKRFAEADLVFHDSSRFDMMCMIPGFLDQFDWSKVISFFTPDSGEDWFHRQMDAIDTLPIYGVGPLVEELVELWFLGKSRFSRGPGIQGYTAKRKGSEIAAQNEIPIPPTINAEDFEDGVLNFPMVIKPNNGGKGKGIYVLRSNEELEALLGKRPRRWYQLQEVIETPSNHLTYYRIVTTGDGSILNATLVISPRPQDQYQDQELSETEYKTPKIVFHTESEKSPIAIPLMGKDPKPLTELDKQMLEEHGIDPANPKIPGKLEDLARKNAHAFAQYGVLWGGQDWIQNGNGFYFLEMQDVPGTRTAATCDAKDTGRLDVQLEVFAKQLATGIANYLRAS